MRTPDKSTLSQSERQLIVNHLDKKPEDYKYLIEGSSSNATIKINSDSKNSAKTASYTIGEYMQLQPQNQSEPDYGASVELDNFSGGLQRLIYRWTILKNALGLFNLISQENLMVGDNGPLSPFQGRYSIYSAQHQASYLSGDYGPLGWSETSSSTAPGQYSAWFTVGGNLNAPQGTPVPVHGNRFANITSVVGSNGLYNNGF
ncbi:hypothetical protein [Flavobacterium sp. S87F.05.LMB.W.Kidney.N]|uniref:hypothetical protein n=1 Tax=Flavobacterium sp. S87F.05.LMB.W.Kidney.N TaxID=1278758 RepID=UPI001066CE9B|nr:hypothetical protein [Flavobacterium sp. S87F.05.LMB.W.Kidney.N]